MMRRRRVVDQRLYIVIRQILSEAFPLLRPDHKHVPNVRLFIVSLRQDNSGIGDMLPIMLGDLTATRIILIEVGQLHV